MKCYYNFNQKIKYEKMKGDIRTMKCIDELNKEKDKKLKQQNYK